MHPFSHSTALTHLFRRLYAIDTYILDRHMDGNPFTTAADKEVLEEERLSVVRKILDTQLIEEGIQ